MEAGDDEAERARGPYQPIGGWIAYLREHIPADQAFIDQVEQGVPVSTIEDKMVTYVRRLDLVEPTRTLTQLRERLAEILVEDEVNFKRNPKRNRHWITAKIFWLLFSDAWRTVLVADKIWGYRGTHLRKGHKRSAPKPKPVPNPVPAPPHPTVIVLEDSDDEKGGQPEPDPMDVVPQEDGGADQEMPDIVVVHGTGDDDDDSASYMDRVLALCREVDAEYAKSEEEEDMLPRTNKILWMLSKASCCEQLELMFKHSNQLETHMTRPAMRLLFMRWKSSHQIYPQELYIPAVPNNITAFGTIFRNYYERSVKRLLMGDDEHSLLAVVDRHPNVRWPVTPIEEEKLRRAFTFVIRSGESNRPLLCFDLSMHPDDTGQQHVKTGGNGGILEKRVSLRRMRGIPAIPDLFQNSVMMPPLYDPTTRLAVPLFFGDWLRFRPIAFFVTILYQFDRNATLSVTSTMFERRDVDDSMVEHDKHKWIDASIHNSFTFRSAPK